MIRTHHQQPTLWTGFLKEEINDLWEPWMRAADGLLDDEQLIDTSSRRKAGGGKTVERVAACRRLPKWCFGFWC